MSAFAPLVLNDGESTPVAHTFAPVKIDAAGVAHYADRSGGIALGFPQATFALRSSTKTSRNYKATGKLVVPTLETVTGPTTGGIAPAPTKAYDLIGSFEFVLPDRSTKAERRNVRVMLMNMIAQDPVFDGIDDLESTY